MGCNLANFDICLRTGDTTSSWSFSLMNEIGGKPLDISKHKFLYEVRKGNESMRRLTEGEGLSKDKETLTVNRILIEDLPNGDYSHALKMINPNGEINTILKGTLRIQPELVANE